MQTDFGDLAMFKPIELSQMDSIMLMNRIDTKYLTDAATLGEILKRAALCGYSAFEMSGRRVHEYRSMYYDSPSLRMYLDHHNRRLVRQKLRTRCYGTTGRTFLELKSKNNHGRTKKKRMEIAPDKYLMMNGLADSCLSEWLDGKMTGPSVDLMPALETVFSRITLVNPEKTERTTVDFDLSFNNIRRGTTADMGGLAIIEVKQDGNLPSLMRDILLDLRVKPVRISKYCIGTAMTDATAKSCRFKEKMILINKMKNRI